MIYGYGNPGRQDDALGVLLASQMEVWARKKGLKSMDFDSNYQLNIEDAHDISGYDMVVFADASIEDIDDFSISKVIPSQKTEFTMHAVSPEFVLHLCQSLYHRFPETYLIHIKGYHFEFLEEVTESAQKNLEKSIDFLKEAFSRLDYSGEALDRAAEYYSDKLKISAS